MRNATRVLTLVSLLAISWMTIAAAQQPARQTAPAASGKKLALVGGMLLTGYDVPPIHHAAVVVEGNKIVAAAHKNGIRVHAHVYAERDVRNSPVVCGAHDEPDDEQLRVHYRSGRRCGSFPTLTPCWAGAA